MHGSKWALSGLGLIQPGAPSLKDRREIKSRVEFRYGFVLDTLSSHFEIPQCLNVESHSQLMSASQE